MQRVRSNVFCISGGRRRIKYGILKGRRADGRDWGCCPCGRCSPERKPHGRWSSASPNRFKLQLLAAPLTDRPLSYTHYALLADSANNHPYIQDAFSPEELHPIAQLPDLPELEREALPAASAA